MDKDTVEAWDKGSTVMGNNGESIPPFIIVPQILGLAGFGQRRTKLNDGPSENPEDHQHLGPCHQGEHKHHRQSEWGAAGGQG